MRVCVSVGARASFVGSGGEDGGGSGGSEGEVKGHIFGCLVSV